MDAKCFLADEWSGKVGACKRLQQYEGQRAVQTHTRTRLDTLTADEPADVCNLFNNPVMFDITRLSQ